jgi:DNA-binding NarL/FixJ family response regulator
MKVKPMAPYVLIVDADVSAAQVTSAIVTRTVSEATVELAPAVQRVDLGARNHYPDVLIIDPSPHDRAAIQLIRELKAARPDARVIVLASGSNPTLRRTITDLHVDAYLEKPILLGLFTHQLRVLLRSAAPAHTELV